MKLIVPALVLAVACRMHVTVWLGGYPFAVPVPWFAAVTVVLPFAALMLAGRRALACNRPRFYWNTVIA